MKRSSLMQDTLLALALVVTGAPSYAEQSAGDSIWTRDKLTGDWGGLRTDLSERGIDIGLRLSQYYQGVTSGGVDTNSEYGGTMDYRVNVDTNKLFGTWKGFSVNMHARTRFGQDIIADPGSLVLPNGGMMMPSPGDYHGTDITGLMVSQSFTLFGGPASVTLGKLDAIDMVTGFFPNVAYGQEGFWNVNALASNMPWFGAVQGLSLYGGEGVTINQEYKMAQSGVLFTGTTNVATHWGSISDAFEDGVWLAGFHRFFWKMDDKPGYFMVFGGYSTKEQASNDPHDFINIPGQGIVSTDQKKPWDVALYVYQEFWQAEGDANRKATFFTGATVGPDNPQFAQWNYFASVEMFGLIESRPHDRMGVAGWWNGLSPNFKDLVSPVADLRNTYGVEAYYNVAINPWLHLSGDLQLVKNERKGDDLAVIPGVRLVIDF
jgi:porin